MGQKTGERDSDRSLIQTGNFRKLSILVFSGVEWDAYQRRRGGIDLQRVSFSFGGSWNRVLSHSASSPYKSK